jgi:hypothetical protein
MPDPSVLPTQKKTGKAVRLVFSFDGDHVTLDSQQSVEMVLPPSDPIEGTEKQNGFWFELRDAQNRPLYRKVMHHPAREDVEVFSNDPAQHSVVRQTVPDRKGVFVVLVPDLENGHTITLSSSPRALALAHQPAKEIGRYALKK